ncbi:MAG TPA: HEAT repeat domain-containing protein, partial [Thermoanaerobaculia bacterium]|nr:HEAT repeat domain-containing protein [Thermoanaerobaculia bacterium]
MRNVILAALVILAACTTAPPPPPSPAPTAPAAPQVHGLTIEEEATVLRLEDRREIDPIIIDTWIANTNSLHRARIALALGRIGPHTFADTNGNGVKDPGEMQLGVGTLGTLVHDPEPLVRINAAFALGQIGDPAAVDALFQFAHDADARVAAEAVEALSKIPASVPLARYSEFTAKEKPDGIRGPAIRFLFRFKSDEASALALPGLESTSPLIRREAAYSLARRGYAPAREKLELMLTDPDTLTRAYAAAALGRIAAKESIGILLKSLIDPQPWVRTNAVVAISRIAQKEPASLQHPDIAEDVARVLAVSEDPDPGTRAAAIDALGWYARISDDAMNRLFDITSTGSRSNRELAAGAIIKARPEAFHTTAAKVVETATPWTKVKIAEALDPKSELGHSYLAELAGDADIMVRAVAIGRFADELVDGKENAPIIRAALNDPDVIIRANAIDRAAQSKSDPPETKIAVLRAAEERGREDKLSDARLGAITALAAVDWPGREAFLRALVGDRDPVVRRAAAEAIEKQLKLPRPQFTPLPIDRPLAEYMEIARWSRQPHTATIHTARGNIELSLATQDAPMTAWNFAQLARKGYFNGTTFMRVVPNFVIQGGDPRNDQNGGPGYAIRDEINLQKYTRAAVGMALSGPDTGGSQFFITHSPQPHLD